MKKKIVILLFVVILIAAGCGNKKTEVAMNTEPTETAVEETTETKKVSETEMTTESEEEETEATETDNKEEQNAQSVNETSKSNTQKQTESKKTQTSNNDSASQSNGSNNQSVEPQPTEPVQQKPTPQPEPQVINYSPQNVVALATAKTKAAGKVLLTENLDNMLASGQISQEEYNEYYPYDGAGYYSVFVDSNMAEARSVSGTTSFNSEDEIAQYISDMLVLENGPYFLIEYAGTYDYYGKQCYEFRCYRA